MQPRMLQKCEQTCKLVLNKENTVSGAICHLYKLGSDESVSYVVPKHKDTKGCGIANKLSKIDQAW